MTILFCSIRLGIFNANQDKQDSKRTFSISTVNNLEYTDERYNYIGECVNAIFLYQKEHSSTIILSKSNIVSIVYDMNPPRIYKQVIEDLEKNNKKQKKY